MLGIHTVIFAHFIDHHEFGTFTDELGLKHCFEFFMLYLITLRCQFLKNLLSESYILKAATECRWCYVRCTPKNIKDKAT